MKIGKVERLVLFLLQKHSMSTGAISNIMLANGFARTGPSVRRAVKSLRRKGLVDNLNKLTQEGSLYIKGRDSDHIHINIDDLDINRLGNELKVGTKGKMLLYILSKIDHASLQFLTAMMKESAKNVSAVLSRLEYDGLVYGYRNMMAFKNVRGRRYRPKYYRITNLGIIVASVARAQIRKSVEAVDSMLEDTLRIKSEMRSQGSQKYTKT
jgi:DNA-binding MarR family transcriptional regulator